MSDHCAKHSRAIVGGDRADYDSVCARRFVVIKCTRFEDRELEIRLLGVLKGELFVVWDIVRMGDIDGDKASYTIVNMWIAVTTYSLPLRR